MARRFTKRKNGQMMTTFRVRLDLSQEQIDDLIGRYEKFYGHKEKIEEILDGRLTAGLEVWWLDKCLDPSREDKE